MSDERLRRALQAAFPPVDPVSPARDLWGDVSRRIGQRDFSGVWLDLTLAAAVTAVLLFVPEWLLLLLYHL